MRRALELAQRGRFQTWPNPMVGCVIVRDDQLLSEGWHQRFGGAHAEVNAVRNLPDDLDLADCTAYVTLEPCSHHGKTPPCADLLINEELEKWWWPRLIPIQSGEVKESNTSARPKSTSSMDVSAKKREN